jgi:putative ABC transport system permease protein
MFPWSTAFRIAWREMRASRAKFLFVVLAVAVGTGALTGIRGFSVTFRKLLLRDARTLMAGDMSIRIFGQPSTEQEKALRSLESRGVRSTRITETVTMASSERTPDPTLLSIKAVDPRAYPYYGEVKLNPPQPLAQALTPETAAVSDDLLLRLNVSPGDMLRLGVQEFRIAGVVTAEPDRMTGTLNVGPRVLLSREALDRTGLISPGSRASERFLLRLPASGRPSVEQVRTELRAVFGHATIADYRETHPIITHGLDRATTFLSLIGLIALVIGAMGVGSAMHGHLQQKLDSIAVMKCIGASSSQVIRIYTVQTLMLGLAGGLLGVVFGLGVAAAFPGFLSQYFQISSAPALEWGPALQGIAIACLVTLLFTVPPLLGIRGIRPAAIFRRNMEGERFSRRRLSLPLFAAGGAIVLGLGVVAATLTEGRLHAAETGTVFSLGIAAGIALLSASAWVLLRALRALERRAARILPGPLRHGIANIYRPGNQASAAVVSLGIGVMFTFAVFLVQKALVGQIQGSAPPGTPNVFLLDIPAAHRDDVAALLRAQRGVTDPPQIRGAVQARLVSVDGVPVERLALGGWSRRFQRPRSVTALDAKPPETEILAGAWWQPGERAPLVCASDESARMLNLRAGSVIEWNAWDRIIRTRVACIQRTESIRMTAHFEFVFNPGQLEGLPAVYFGSARVTPADVPALQRAVYARYPTVTVVNVADVMKIVQDVVDRITLVVRFISAFTIMAGAIMVASAIAGTRFRRIREVVILKTLGATRRRIATIFSVEFLILGAVAGVMGSLLASAFSAVALNRLLDISFRPGIGAAAATVALSAVVAAVAGWAASFRVLGKRPLEILREE